MSKINKKKKRNSPNHGDQALILWPEATPHIELQWKDGTVRDGYVPNGRSLSVGVITGSLWREIMLGYPYVHVESIHHYYLRCAGSWLTCSSQKLMAKKSILLIEENGKERIFYPLWAVWKMAVSTLKHCSEGGKINRGREKKRKGK